jgi:uncharacterized protein (DUF2267 family)
MQEDEFLDAVQRRTQLDSRDGAYTATRATPGVLDQRIMEGEAENIASQLPEPLGQLLTEEREEAEAFSIDEFVDWVQRRENEEGNVDRAGTVDHIVV